MDQIEKNISQTDPHKLLQSFKENRFSEIRIQNDCLNRIRREEENVKSGKIKCKSGSKRFIKYLKCQFNVHYQREVLYYALEQAIMNGDYVGEKS